MPGVLVNSHSRLSRSTLKTPEYIALDASSVHVVKGFQAKKATLTDHLHVPDALRSFHMWPLIILMMLFWGHPCSLDEDAEAKRSCVTCVGSHRWKTVELGFEYQCNWLQTPSSSCYTVTVICCLSNAAWWCMTGNHKTSVVCNNKCILLTLLESAGSQPGTCVDLGWAGSHVCWLTGLRLIEAGLVWSKWGGWVLLHLYFILKCASPGMFS